MCPNFSRLALVAGLVASCMAVACSSGSSGSSQSSLTLALTDAASDDISSFTVGITSIELTQAGGGVIDVLPSPVTVDLLTLQAVSRVLNVLSVPVGNYTAVDVTLDFSGASAYLTGNSMPATLMDTDGNPLPSSLTLPIAIGNLLNAHAGGHRILEFDFDLDQSLVTDLKNNTVMVEPTFVTRVDRSNPKELVVGGALQGVNLISDEVSMELQLLNQARITDVVLDVDAGTIYQVDGTPYIGSAGLAALQLLSAGTWVQCYGAIDLARGRISATHVEAGMGTYNGGSDIVEGHVIGRIGTAGADPILMVMGRSNDRTHTSFQFNTVFTVNGSFAGTNVVRRGSPAPCDTDDINIGQRVRFFGDLSGVNLDVSAATAVARLQPTRALGFTRSPLVGTRSPIGVTRPQPPTQSLGYSGGTLQETTMRLDLARIGLRGQSSFAWGEGGGTPADPDAVVVNLGSLAATLNLAAGVPVEVLGHFSAVDNAGPDFMATDIINHATSPSLMILHDRIGGMNVTTSASASDIQFAISSVPGVAEIAVIDRGFVGSSPLPVSPAPTVSPAGPVGIYIIRDRATGAVSLNLGFASFAQELDALLAQSAQLRNFSAVGQYDDVTNGLLATLVVVVLD